MTTVFIDSHFEEFIKSQVAQGRYRNADDVIRAGLHLLESEGSKAMKLRNAIMEGDESGIAEGFTPDSFLSSMKQKKANA